ncbi:MAG: amino acid ABC transporter permease [Alphaproteobacteria bacterium]|nr:amino acid ABC transporter permease [Alphaproteobacteria bacterium]
MDYTFQFDAVFANWPLLFDGVLLTIRLSIVTMASGLLIGILGAYVLRFGPRWGIAIVRSYVEVFRNTPLLVQLFFIYFGLPSIGLPLSPNTAAVWALGINLGAYTIEIIRSGLLGVPAGLVDAGRSLGLTDLKIYLLILLRPALVISFPALSSQFIVLLLGTSVVSTISAEELTAVASSIQSRTFRSFEIYLAVLAIYLALSLTAKAILYAISRRFIYAHLKMIKG